MAHGDDDPEFIGQHLQFPLRRAPAVAIAAATVGIDQKSFGGSVAGSAKHLPPAPYARHRKRRGAADRWRWLLLTHRKAASGSPRIEQLSHPGGTTGYRITWRGKSVAYLTDTEHTPGRPDVNVAALAKDADLLIYDTSFTDQELPARTGWGHSTWQEGIRVANAASARQLVLFHHDSGRLDKDLDAIVAAAVAVRPGTIAAYEGLVVKV